MFTVARLINLVGKFGYKLVNAYGTRTVFPNIKESNFPRNESTLADCLIFSKLVDVLGIPTFFRGNIFIFFIQRLFCSG